MIPLFSPNERLGLTGKRYLLYLRYFIFKCLYDKKSVYCTPSNLTVEKLCFNCNLRVQSLLLERFLAITVIDNHIMITINLLMHYAIPCVAMSTTW